MIYFLSKYLALFLLKLLFHFRVAGRASIPREGPCIIISNHSSYLDPIVIGCASPRRVYFVAKEELFRHPVARFFLHQLGAFPLRRQETDQTAVKKIFALLKRGKVVCLFPEGTRNDGVLREFKSGVIKLLLRARVPIVIAGIRGTYESLPRGAKYPRLFPIRVVFSSLALPPSCRVEEAELDIRTRLEVLLGDPSKRL